ncbi:MAG: hypothetical protein IKU18_00240 [Bacteroidales bacterium]|nr:hypothetical protein [Bacteroidales bacterium]
MVVALVGVSAVALIAGVTVWYLWSRLNDYRRECAAREKLAGKYGVYIEVSPLQKESVADSVRKEVEACRELMHMTYMSCDNFAKYQGNIAETVAGMYENRLLHSLCGNIVIMANLAEDGAFYKLAEEFKLSELELRTCCFIHFGFKWQETCTADTLTENAYSVRCSRIRKKMGLAKEERIPDFLANYCKLHTGVSFSAQ